MKRWWRKTFPNTCEQGTVAIIKAAAVKESVHMCNVLSQSHNFLCTCIAIDTLHERHCVQPNGLSTFKT